MAISPRYWTLLNGSQTFVHWAGSHAVLEPRRPGAGCFVFWQPSRNAAFMTLAGGFLEGQPRGPDWEWKSPGVITSIPPVLRACSRPGLVIGLFRSTH